MWCTDSRVADENESDGPYGRQTIGRYRLDRISSEYT